MGSYWHNVKIGFCPNEKAWRKYLKSINLPALPYPDSDACVQTFTCGAERSCLVCVHPKFDRLYRSKHVSVVGLLVHECTHVWQQVLKHIGETEKPSSEIEAYNIQYIFQQIYSAYIRTRIKKR